MTSGMMTTDYCCLTCGLPIMENTTSTTTCVKCAKLRTRRRNFAQPWTPGTPPGVLVHPAPPIQQTPSVEENRSTCPSANTPGKRAGKERNDSKDSGVSSGSSQDYDLSTPPVEKPFIFPWFPTPNRTDRPSVPFSQLVRKLSEVEGIPPNINIIGKTSLDEGVEVFENNQENNQRILHGHNHIHVRSFEGQQGHASNSYGALAQKAFAATAPSSQTSSCFNSIESYPYESLDETRTSAAQTPCGAGPGPPSMADNNELTQSLPSCNNTLIQIVEPASEMELVMQDQHQTYAVHQSLLQQHQNYQIVMQQQQMQLQQQQQQNSQQGNKLSVATDATGQRQLMRSPVSFREGRRASDGLVAQAGFVAFQQRLYDKGKAHGLVELHDVHLEHKALQHQFGGSSGSNNSSRSGTPDSSLVQQGQQMSADAASSQSPGGAAVDLSRSSKVRSQSSASTLRPSITKRISVPENFTYFPTSTSSADQRHSDKLGLVQNPIGLQHQLMQHRIYQKRQNMPKSALMLGTSSRRNLLTRQSGLKVGKPYLPQDIYCTSASMCGGISNDFLFQPIAEDEADTAASEANVDTKSSSCVTSATSAASTGMVLLSVPTCMSMPSSPTPMRPYTTPHFQQPPPASRTPPVILMEEDVEEVMSIDLTSAHATLTTTSDPYWQTLPSHMAESCRLEANSPSPMTSRRLNPPNKLEVTKVSPSSPNRSPLLQTGTSCKVEPPPLKATSPETMDISPK